MSGKPVSESEILIGKRPRFKSAELVLPCGMLDQIKRYLFADTSREYACYLLCGHVKIGQTLRLLGCFLVLPEPADYDSQSLGHVRLRRDLLIQVLQECERHGLSLIDIHSHPFASHSVHFSSIDEQDEQEKAAWFAAHLPHAYYGSIVLGRDSHNARIRSADGSMIELDLPIRSVQAPLGTRRAKTAASGGKTLPFLDRQVRAFGAAGQMRIAEAHFAIIGLGGIGAGLAIGLGRLGATQFTLIDPDTAEPHNLNRVMGMTATDAKLHLKKTDIVARELLSINPKNRCRLVDKSVLDRTAWRALLRADLIITTTDNHASRMLLNVISHMFLIPQISIGTVIDARDGKVEGGYGHVFVLLPGHGRPCPVCARIINPVEAYYETASPEHRREAARRGYIANVDEPAPAVVHLNGVVTHLALVEIHNLFCAFKEPAQHLLYDMFEQEIVTIAEGERQCATCSPGGGYFGRGDLVRLTDLFKELRAQ
jgi:molybdopterin/thiamine biosynthesis adenylyltransferase